MGLILIPSEVIESANEIRTFYTDILHNYRSALQVIENFASDEEIDTVAWNTLKMKVFEYHQAIVQGMISAEESLQDDAASLEQSAGSEELYEDILLELIERQEAEKKEKLAEIQRLENLRNNVIVSLFDSVCIMIGQAIMQLNNELYIIEQLIDALQEKLQFLYAAENNTKTLFTAVVQLMIAIEAAINDAGVEITGAGEVSDKGWRLIISDACAKTDEKIKNFIEEALQSELQIDLNELEELYGDNVVKRMIEIMKKSGLSRLDDGNAVKFIETAMLSITGYQVTKVDGKYEYVDKNGIKKDFTSNVLEKILDLDRYIDISTEVAQWYVSNVDKYCQMTMAEIIENGGPSTEGGRCFYKCDLEGNLNGISVANDCSGYVWAALVQAGYFDSSTTIYTSSAYLPGGLAVSKMEEAGFTWYSMSELSGDDLKKGDILVKNGHVEIFYDYDDDDKELALTWGSVYKKLPALKDAKKTNIDQKYKGIWRLEP